MAAKKVALLLGKCVPSVKPSSSKICITKMELDVNLLMYFKNNTHVYAHDPDKKCKSGDVVLIEELPQKLSKEVTHRVVEIVYPMGDVIDPLTQKKVVMSEFRDDIVEKNKLYGENKNAFDYEKAPPRGRFEGKRDFTDKETYKKFHEIPGVPQPYGI
uniref:28S ribosomal protein S17, mitochondrial n=1 Tax=Lygus hesperus TaxID=30085 RepID=A0A0A9WG07_LYGHE